MFVWHLFSILRYLDLLFFPVLLPLAQSLKISFLTMLFLNQGLFIISSRSCTEGLVLNCSLWFSRLKFIVNLLFILYKKLLCKKCFPPQQMIQLHLGIQHIVQVENFLLCHVGRLQIHFPVEPEQPTNCQQQGERDPMQHGMDGWELTSVSPSVCLHFRLHTNEGDNLNGIDKDFPGDVCNCFKIHKVNCA